ncbi:hypothetical protein [Metabacillus iocasae]|uniref:Uncharacterized protein n=1 Tax=Priestia iocasae TaxID=2291674 RepID=A0ABS2QTW1_9BACI|nr:hypothetical protein [Metabacillus iocasae]MBM7702909.1 hypothetical protein [Metabacillus iocasae]
MIENQLKQNVSCFRVFKVYDYVQKMKKTPTRQFFDIDIIGEDFCILCTSPTNIIVSCQLVDELGNSISLPSSLSCQEQSRQDVTVHYLNETIPLQKVRLQQSGYYVIHLTDPARNVTCTSNPIPFSFTENVILCAPPDTTINCEVVDMTCETDLQIEGDTIESLSVSLYFCQRMTSGLSIPIEMKHLDCQPRPDLISISCHNNVIPPSCASIFPDVYTK